MAAELEAAGHLTSAWRRSMADQPNGRPVGATGLSQKENERCAHDTPSAAIDTDNVARVKHVYGYDFRRAVRVYFYDFDGACEYLDPDGELYEAFKKAGISASQPAVRTDAASV